MSHRGRAGHQARIAMWVVALTCTLFTARADAEQLKVFISGGFNAPYRTLVTQWEKATGHTVVAEQGPSMGATPTAIPNRLARGEQADIVILAREALDGLVKGGRVIAGSQVDLVRSRIGMSVKAGMPKPDISTEARFRQVLLDAKSIGHSDSASGVYITNELLKRLGIADQVAARLKLIPGTPVGEAVARGEVEIGFQQVSELIPVAGATYAGPLPDSLQRVTTFSGGVTTTSRAAALARELLAFFASEKGWDTIRKTGLDPAGAPVGAGFGGR